MSNDNDPCRICGSSVRLETRPEPRRLGEKVARTHEVRVCTNRECNTNAGRNRRLGATP